MTTQAPTHTPTMPRAPSVGDEVRARRAALDADSEASRRRELQAQALLKSLLDEARTTSAERERLAKMEGQKTLSEVERVELKKIHADMVERLPGRIQGSLLHTFPRPLRHPPTQLHFRPRNVDRSDDPS